jgi:hypothetical protein
VNVHRVQATERTGKQIIPKSENTSDRRVSGNITRMVLAMLILSLLGHTPYMVVYIANVLLKNNKSWKNVGLFIKTLSFITLMLGHSCYIFIFYFFNKVYRDVLREKLHLS